MVPTRRQLLSTSAALLAGVAGCSEDSPAPTPTPTVPAVRGPAGNVATDPPTVTLRRPGARDPIVTVPDPDERVGRSERAHRRAVERGFVTTREAASWLRIEDVEGADAARQFLEETDFGQSYVFVDRTAVPQCFQHLLCYVEWNGRRLDRTYAEVYRDHDVACSADERDRAAWFVRLDGSVDPLQVESGGTHTQFDGCPRPPGERDDHRADGPPDDSPTDAGDVPPGTSDTPPTMNETGPVDGPPTADLDVRSGRWER